MKNTTLKFIFREISQIKWQRKFSSCSVAGKSDSFIIKSPLPDIVLGETRFLDRLWAESSHFNTLVALECAETKKAYTYQQLKKYVAVFATSLHQKLGLKRGDTLCAMLPNCPEFAVVALGTMQAGIALTTFNPLYKEYEVSHQITTTNPKVIVTIPECYDVVVKALLKSKKTAKIVIVDKNSTVMPKNTTRYTEIAENEEVDYKLLDKIENKLEDVAVVPFSSGTTGLPKGVDISFKNVLSAVEIMKHEKVCYPKLASESFQDVVPCILPFFHIYGLVITLIGHLTKGCKLVTMPKFSATLYLDILKSQDVTLLYIVPPIAVLLAKHPEVKKEHLRHIRHIVCGAAPLSGSDVKPILDKSNGKLSFYQGFGATETTSLATTHFIGSQINDYSSSGFPMSSMELKFVDPASGNAVPIGESGELYVRGPVVMKGYHGNEQATRESLTEDGFFKTGDLGYFKPDSGLFLKDRIKELIKVKGMQVAPAELEGILRSHPAVEDAGVIGVPHDFYGEVPKAIVIPKKGQNVSPEEIKSFVKDKVAVFKNIEHVVFVEHIPKTASGKILRKELKKMHT